MKKHFLILLLFPIFFGCDNNSPVNNNPFLPNYGVNLEINLSLPQFSDLKFISNSVYVAGQGVRGIIIFNSTGKDYMAFDAACPNQAISDCSTMTLKGGIVAVCACDETEYSLFTGQCLGQKCTGKQYSMKQYRVEVIGNVLRVYN